MAAKAKAKKKPAAKKPAPKKATKPAKKVVAKKKPAAKKKVAPKKVVKPTKKKVIAKKKVVAKKVKKVKAVKPKKVKAVKPPKVKKVKEPKVKAVKIPKEKKIKEPKVKPVPEYREPIKMVIATPPVKRTTLQPLIKPIVRKTTVDSKKSRYSDKELNEFKGIIVEKLDAAKSELKYLQDQINRKDDNGTDDTENKFATMEDGSASMEREYMNQMAVRQATYIDHLEKALMRIANKTYGICRVTGKLIDKDRLRAVPHATLSMEAKLIQSIGG